MAPQVSAPQDRSTPENPPPPVKTRRAGRLRRAMLIIVLVVMATTLAGGLYQAAATARDLRRYPAPGELIDVGAHRLHLHCTGSGTPTVVLAHAGGSQAGQWALIQPEVATTTRVCSYDRSGFGWSDAMPGDADALSATRELQALLDAAGEAGPYVLVGHSYGSFVAELYAVAHPRDTAGVVLVDPGYALGTPGVPADVDTHMRDADAAIIRYGPWAARIGLFRVAAAFGMMDGKRDLPGEAGAAFDQASLRTRHWQTIKKVAGAAEPTSRQVLDARERLDGAPLLVLSAGQPDSRDRREWTEANERIADAANGVHLKIRTADHMGLVLDARTAAAVTTEILGFLEHLRGQE
jgi:pimeloyl-ACP methyl ester carboxylesterase